MCNLNSCDNEDVGWGTWGCPGARIPTSVNIIIHSIHAVSLLRYNPSLILKHLTFNICFVMFMEKIFVSKCSLKIFKTFYLLLLGAGGGVLSAGEI